MRAGRKKAVKIGLQAAQFSPEREFVLRCHWHLNRGEDPSPTFFRELLHRYVEAVKLKPLSGPELAAFVDYQAVMRISREPSLSVAAVIEICHQMLLEDPPSIEALTQHHKRYGMSSKEIKVAARKRAEIYKVVECTPELIEIQLRRYSEHDAKRAVYEKAKKDFFGDS